MNILKAIAQFQLEFCKCGQQSARFQYPTKKSSQLPSEPHHIHFNMTFVKPSNLKNFPKHQI